MTASQQAAARAARKACVLTRQEGEYRQLDAYHQGFLRVTVLMTPKAQLIMRTRYRLYSTTSGHSVPSAPAVTEFTTEQRVRELLAEHGVELPPMEFYGDPARLPRKLKKTFAKPFGKWGRRESRRAARYLLANA